MTQFNWNEGNLNWLKCKCQINLHTNCRFSVIGARNQSIPEMPFSSEMPASTQYQRTVPVLVQSRSAVNCNEKNQLSGCPYISNQQRDCSFNCVDLGSGETSWQISLYDITNKDRMYAHHFHATYVTCGGWMCVVHIHRYIDHYASLHPLASAVSSNAASIVSSNAMSLGCRECLSERVFCLRISNHLELKKPNAWGP